MILVDAQRLRTRSDLRMAWSTLNSTPGEYFEGAKYQLTTHTNRSTDGLAYSSVGTYDAQITNYFLPGSQVDGHDKNGLVPSVKMALSIDLKNYGFVKKTKDVDGHSSIKFKKPYKFAPAKTFNNECHQQHYVAFRKSRVETVKCLLRALRDGWKAKRFNFGDKRNFFDVYVVPTTVLRAMVVPRTPQAQDTLTSFVRGAKPAPSGS